MAREATRRWRRGWHARHADELPAWPRVEDDPAPGGLGRLLARLGQVSGWGFSVFFLFCFCLFVLPF